MYWMYTHSKNCCCCHLLLCVLSVLVQVTFVKMLCQYLLFLFQSASVWAFSNFVYQSLIICAEGYEVIYSACTDQYLSHLMVD